MAYRRASTEPEATGWLQSGSWWDRLMRKIYGSPVAKASERVFGSMPEPEAVPEEPGFDWDAFYDAIAGAGAGAGAGATKPAFQPTYYAGKWHTTPQSLSDAMRGYAQTRYGRELGWGKKEFERTRGGLREQRGEMEAEIPKAEETALVRTARRFGALSPDVYQSAQAGAETAIEKKAAGALKKGRTALDRAMAELGTSWEQRQTGLEDWLASEYERAANLPMGFAGGAMGEVPLPGYTPYSPDLGWNLPEMIGGIQGLGGKGVPPKAPPMFGAKGQTAAPEDLEGLEKYIYG